MKDKLKAKRLKPGSRIGIVSVSAPEASLESGRFEQGLDQIRQNGYEIVVSAIATQRFGYLNAPSQEMADEINRMFADKSIDAIICVGGGTNANRLLKYLDFRVIQENPKIFQGVSNPTVILNAIWAKTNLVCFHGPAVIWDFGAPNGLSPYTLTHWLPLLTEPTETRTITPTANWKWIRKGAADGIALGGNLTSLQQLLGTPFEPDWSGAVLFWEDVAKPINRLDMMLTHFRDAGVFDKIVGMVVGSLVECETPAGGQTIEQVLTDLTSQYAFPILSNVDFGHTQDKATLPLGGKMNLDSEYNRLAINEQVVI